MPKFTAVMGKSKTNRIVSVEAPTEDRARYLIHQQLGTNAQRRQIRDQWVADGEHIVADSPTPTFDEGQANALIRGRLAELLAELSEHDQAFEVSASQSLVWGYVTDAIDRARDAYNAFERGMEV